MTQSETITILNRLSRLYMSQAKKLTSEERRDMIGVWQDTFKGDSYDEVNRAVSAYVNRGKPFMPNPPDIINELTNLEQYGDNALFNRLRNEADKAHEGRAHITIDDLGGVVRDETSPTGWRNVVAETHVSRNYTQADFAALPMELQLYADDVEGLKRLHDEINSNPAYARRRFMDALPALRARTE